MNKSKYVKLNRVGQPRTHLTPKEIQVLRDKETARRRTAAKKARNERRLAARAKAGIEARENDPTGKLQAMYEAFIPTNQIRGITSKYVTDKWGNRVRRTEVTV